MSGKKLFSYTFWLLVAMAYGLTTAWGFTQGVVQLSKTFSHFAWSNGMSYQPSAVINVSQPTTQQSVGSQSPIVTSSPPPEPEDTFSLLFVGDIMLDRGVRSVVGQQGGGNYNWLFESVQPVLKTGDIVFGNLEGPAADGGTNHGSQYSFRMDPASLAALAATGFDIVSVANNHSGDWGREAFVETINHLEDQQIMSVGNRATTATVDDLRIILVDGYKIGFLAATDVGPDWLRPSATEPGVWLATDPNWPQVIREAAPAVNFLVVSYHFGEEYQTVPSARQRELAQLAIDNGATMVIGHHPHVLQPIERYQDGLIAYSLGNFIFDQGFSDATKAGGILKINLNKNGIVDWQLLPTTADDWYRPIVEVESAGVNN